MTLREIVRARDERRRQLRHTLQERRHAVDSLLNAKRWTMPPDPAGMKGPTRQEPAAPKLKRYFND